MGLGFVLGSLDGSYCSTDPAAPTSCLTSASDMMLAQYGRKRAKHKSNYHICTGEDWKEEEMGKHSPNQQFSNDRTGRRGEENRAREEGENRAREVGEQMKSNNQESMTGLT